MKLFHELKLLNGTRPVLICLITLLLSCGAAPLVESDPSGEQPEEEFEELPESSVEYMINSKNIPTVVISTGRYKITFVANMSWTISELTFNEKRVFTPTGAFQPVINEKGIPSGVDQFLGTGHRPETIVALEVVEINNKGEEINVYPVNEVLDIKGESNYIFRKTSEFKSDYSDLHYLHESRITITDKGIIEDYSFKGVGDDYTNLNYFYMFMHCMPKSIKSWLAGDEASIIEAADIPSEPSGAVLDGKDVRFLGFFDPMQSISTYIIYPKIYEGHRRKNFINNRQIDNKHYFMIKPAGIRDEEFNYSAVIKVVDIETHDEFINHSNMLLDNF